jgi:hypothetical protein
MDRAQFLTTSLAWQRYGNNVLAKSFLDLANTSKDKSIDDIEKTIITEANMVNINMQKICIQYTYTFIIAASIGKFGSSH